MDIKRIVSLYKADESLRAVARQTGYSAQKIRKALITAGEYKTPLTSKVNSLITSGLKAAEVAIKLGISRSAVNACLPYTRAPLVRWARQTDGHSPEAVKIHACRERALTTGEKIAEKRKYAGMMQLELADKIGVAQKDVSRWETGKRHPRVEMLKRIADTLKCTVDDLI